MEENGKTILKHDPVPGYRLAFYVILGISSVYLIYIFASPFL